MDITPEIVLLIGLLDFSVRFCTQVFYPDLAILLHFIIKMNGMKVVEGIISHTLVQYHHFWSSGLVTTNIFLMIVRITSRFHCLNWSENKGSLDSE